MLHNTETPPTVKLWRAVIKRSILDCCGIFEDSKLYHRKKHRIIFEAESWYNKCHEPESDFEQVCEFANMNPDNVFELKENAKRYFKYSSEEKSTLLSALMDRVLRRYNGKS